MQVITSMQRLSNKTWWNKRPALWMAFASLLVLASCKSARVAVDERNNIPNRKTSEILDSLHASNLSCDWLSIKYDVSFKSTKNSDSFKMYVRMKRDSAIWVSATYYAVEVARFLFTPDTVKYIDRRNNKYYIGNYDYITEQFQIDANFEMIQALVLANSLSLDIESGERVRSAKDEGKYFLSFLRKGQLRRALRKDELKKPIHLVVSLWIEPDHFRVGKMSVADFEENRTLTATYNDFEPTCNSFFPRQVTYFVENVNEQLEVKTSVMKLTADKAVSLSFTIPEKYEPLVP